MKKFYSLILGVTAILASAQIQVENFDGATTPSGWQVAINTGTVPWTFGSAEYGGYVPGFAGNAAVFDDDANGEINNDCDLISPAIDITSYSNIGLTFDYSMEDFAGSGDLIVSVWNGTAWVEIFTQTDDMLFETKTFDVSAYKNAAFQVKFKYVDTDWGWGAGVDNFKLTDESLATSENSGVKISIGPNPAHDVLTIRTTDKVSNIAIYSMTGNKIAVNDTTNKVVDISKLSPGMYIISLEINGKNYTKKFLKK